MTARAPKLCHSPSAKASCRSDRQECGPGCDEGRSSHSHYGYLEREIVFKNGVGYDAAELVESVRGGTGSIKQSRSFATRAFRALRSG